MRENIKELIARLSANIDFPEPIVEIGSYQVEGQLGFADIRPFFPNKKFIGCDMRKGPGVDRVENLQKLTFEDESIGTILMLDTIEHVAPLQKSMEEIYRVLKPSGCLVMTSVMDFPIHDYPEDYWRFTPKGFEYLLKAFPSTKVFFQGHYFFPHTVFGIAKKGEIGDTFQYIPTGWDEINKVQYKNKKNYPATSFYQALEQIEKTQEELKKLKQSWSWKLTAPFRAVVVLLRGKNRV